MSAASKDAMAALHSLIAEKLTKRIADGEASAQDFSNAIKFLKDNGIEADGTTNPALRNLTTHTLPTFGDDEDEDSPVH